MNTEATVKPRVREKFQNAIDVPQRRKTRLIVERNPRVSTKTVTNRLQIEPTSGMSSKNLISIRKRISSRSGRNFFRQNHYSDSLPTAKGKVAIPPGRNPSRIPRLDARNSKSME